MKDKMQNEEYLTKEEQDQIKDANIKIDQLTADLKIAQLERNNTIMQIFLKRGLSLADSISPQGQIIRAAVNA